MMERQGTHFKAKAFAGDKRIGSPSPPMPEKVASSATELLSIFIERKMGLSYIHADHVWKLNKIQLCLTRMPS